MVKGRNYRIPSASPYTRREYIDGVPQPKLVRLDMGNTKAEFPCRVELVAKEEGQIRDNSLESARLAANKYLETSLNVDNYHFRVNLYPHIVLREHRMQTGAGADRLSQGMRRAFGRPIGTAAKVSPGQVIAFVEVNEDGVEKACEALRRATYKIPIETAIIVSKKG
ncbi:MAG: 50S ribosomal protein L16 [Candidatus Bathyarchaeia archaeon]